MSKPQYNIYGKERRELKKKLSHLKRFVKHFWHDHQMDKDMASFYGKTETFPMSDKDAKNMYDDSVEEIRVIEEKLKEPYDVN